MKGQALESGSSSQRLPVVLHFPVNGHSGVDGLDIYFFSKLSFS